MASKASLFGLIALLVLATALAATAHTANQSGDDFFAKVKSVFIEDGKVNTLNASVVAVIVLAITFLVRVSGKRLPNFLSAFHPPLFLLWCCTGSKCDR